MRTTLLTTTLFAAALDAASQAASATIVDVDARAATGTTVHFEAGTYDVRYIGIADGGAFDAWNPWSSVSGCNASGANCATGWYVSSAVDFGHGVGNFDRTDGYVRISMILPDDNRRYATPEQALAASQTVPQVYAPFALASNASAFVAAPVPWQFTLTQAQDVNFFISDSPYEDNSGGISLAVSTVPLPASVMLLAPALLAPLRRRR